MTLEVLETVALRFKGGPTAADDYILSPFVYAGGHEIVVRAVPRLDADPARKISRAFHGTSGDGTLFTLDEVAMLEPGPNVDDAGGVEDPTVVADGDRLTVFYSGWNPVAQRSTLLRAEGPAAGRLTKCGPIFDGDAPQAKEPALVRRDSGWTMFFETEREASCNASATAPALDGPWVIGADVLQPRPGRFDSWHLSPVAFTAAPDGSRVLIYNGADRNAQWQIGWCVLSSDCSRVLYAADQPIVRATRDAPDQRELVFGASIVERNDVLDLYYSIGDTDPTRATLRWRTG